MPDEQESTFSEHLQAVYNLTIPKIKNDLSDAELALLGTMCELAIELARIVPPETLVEAMRTIQSAASARVVLHNAMKKKHEPIKP